MSSVRVVLGSSKSIPDWKRASRSMGTLPNQQMQTRQAGANTSTKAPRKSKPWRRASKRAYGSRIVVGQVIFLSRGPKNRESLDRLEWRCLCQPRRTCRKRGAAARVCREIRASRARVAAWRSTPYTGPVCRANRSARLGDERFSDPRMATLHHHPICPQSRFIRLVLGEIGLDVELKEERVWERRREFLALNPAGTTPVLSEESIAAVPGAAVIAEYLDETRGLALGDRRLLPEDPTNRVEVR